MAAVSSSRHIYYVMIIGVLVRVLAWSNTHVVNPDGTLYITQAKALFTALRNDESLTAPPPGTAP